MKTMKRMMLLVLLTVVSMGLNAQDAKVKVDIGEFKGGVITEKTQSREVTKNEKDEDVVTYKVTITVTPDEGFFITKDDIDVEATLPLPQKPQKDTDTRADKEEEQTTELAGKLELFGDEPEDLSKEREYTFTVEDGYGAWVMAANFHTAALVLGSDVKEIADGSLVGVKSITIENNQKVIGLGDNDVKGLPVIVPANL